MSRRRQTLASAFHDEVCFGCFVANSIAASSKLSVSGIWGKIAKTPQVPISSRGGSLQMHSELGREAVSLHTRISRSVCRCQWAQSYSANDRQLDTSAVRHSFLCAKSLPIDRFSRNGNAPLELTAHKPHALSSTRKPDYSKLAVR